MFVYIRSTAFVIVVTQKLVARMMQCIIPLNQSINQSIKNISINHSYNQSIIHQIVNRPLNSLQTSNLQTTHPPKKID